MQLKQLVKSRDKVRVVHGAADFKGHTFRFGELTPKGREIIAEPRNNLRRRGKTYKLYGYLVGDAA